MQFDSFIIFGGCGFIGTHMARLLRELRPDAKVYIADIEAEGSGFIAKTWTWCREVESVLPCV